MNTRVLILTAVTTGIGFGSLVFASHRGLESLGVVMAVGSLCCLFATLVLLPMLAAVGPADAHRTEGFRMAQPEPRHGLVGTEVAVAGVDVAAKAAIADNPTTIRAKYSEEWNSSATEARAGAKNKSRIAPSVPPAKEEMAAMVNALPAFP